MQLKLTWRVRGKKDLDLLVLEEQKMAETLEVLVAKGLLEAEVVDGVTHIKSLRTNHQVNVLLSYEEANIHSGDILELEDDAEDDQGLFTGKKGRGVQGAGCNRG